MQLVTCKIKLRDEKTTRECLCAIGEYDENNPEHIEIDDQIFYWFEDEGELKSFMTDEIAKWEQFRVLSYKIEGAKNEKSKTKTVPRIKRK